MPVNGAIFRADKVKLALAGTSTITSFGSGTPAYSYDLTGETDYTPDSVQVYTGYKLHATCSYNGSAYAWSYRYDGPGAPGGGLIYSGSGAWHDPDIYLILDGEIVYCNGSGSEARLEVTGVEVWVDGSLATTLTGSTLNGAGCGPNYVPLLAMPWRVSGSCMVGRSGTAGLPTYRCYDPDYLLPIEYQTRLELDCSASGWSPHVDGEWASWPVEIYDENPGGSCGFNLDCGKPDNPTTDACGCVAIADTHAKLSHYQRVYDMSQLCDDNCYSPPHSNVHPYADDYQTWQQIETQSFELRLLPNLTKKIVRLGNWYSSWWNRLAFPWIKGTYFRSCGAGLVAPGVVLTYTTAPNVYPALPAMSAIVTNAPHAIEDVFAELTYAPSDFNHMKQLTITYERHAPTFTC